MIERLVSHLKKELVSFRLCSYAMPEALPEIAHPRPHGSQTVETYILLADGKPVLACVPRGDVVDRAALTNELHGMIADASPQDLPAPFTGATCVPPLGTLLGLPLFMDARVQGAVLVFHAFTRGDFIEILYDDLERLEHPRIGSFAIAGELPQEASAPSPSTSGADIPVLPPMDTRL